MKMIKIAINKIIDKNINRKTYLIISLILILVGAFMSFYGVSQCVKIIVKYVSVLKPNHLVRKKQENKIPFTYKLYLWNVTNPKEIAAGTEKPKMQEVGPYVFSQFKQKVETDDDETGDYYSFDLWNIYTFNPELSLPLTGDEIVTILNVVLVSAVVKVKLERPHTMNILTEGLDVIFKNPSSIFVTMKATEFIDKGIQVDCNQTTYAAKVVCAEIKRHRSMKATNDDKASIRYRWFEKLNNSIQARYTVLRGSKNIHDVGRVIAVNDEPTLNVYKDNEKCNLINGTDKIFFPPFQQSNGVIWVYAHDACKSFPLRYKYMETIRGVKTSWKNLELSDPLISRDCECNRYTGCAAAGFLDMSNCLDIFVFGSLPHFYTAEPSILESMDGMDPKEHLHKTGIYFDSITGSPILSLERFQISWLVKRIPEYQIFSSLVDDILIPVLWYEEEYSIKKSDLALVIFSRISSLVGLITGYILLGIGIVGCIAVATSQYLDVSVEPSIAKNVTQVNNND